MILTCPNCGTQYVVKDDAIPPEGRQVRCAACKHSWHQDPETIVAGEETRPTETDLAQAADTPPEEADYRPASPQDESVAEAVMVDPRSGPEAEERAYAEAVIEGGGDVPGDDAAATGMESAEPPARSADSPTSAQDWNEPPQAEAVPDMFSPFAENGEVEPRRRRPLLTIIIIALIVIALAAAIWFLAPPDLKARLGLASDSASPLALVVTHKDRQPLESGNELLTITGRVINPTTKEQAVPPLQAQLLDAGGKVVYSWTIDPPARSIPAGGSVGFNSAEVNVPSGGNNVRITLGAPKAGHS
jgi:predicted Zn finger-like uncharacterized protein